MEEKNEFSDILLERDSEAKASKFKKLALIIGSFILIFLFVLVVMKMLNKPSKQNDNSRLAIEQKNTSREDQTRQNDPLFKEVPIIKQDDKKESFEEMVRKLKAKEKNRVKEKTEKAPEIKDVEKKEVVVPIKKIESKEIKPKPVAKPVKVVTPVKKVKKTVKKVKPKKKKVSIPKFPSPKTNTTSGSVKKGTYIQVLATTQTQPDKKFLNSLVKKGYTYHLHRTTIKNQKYLKILVGPYGGYSSAKNALPKVRKELNKSAFVFSLK